MGREGQTRPRPRSWQPVVFSLALGALSHLQNREIGLQVPGSKMHRQVVSGRWHLSPGEEMQALGPIYPLHFAQYDPDEDPTEFPEVCWGRAQPSTESRAVHTGATLTFTVTACVPDLVLKTYLHLVLRLWLLC